MTNTMISHFPELTDSFLSGQDIFYTQFNEIEFYVEDVNQEHLYFNVLKKLFPTLKFEKIFPLNGKEKVIDSAKNNIANKKKVYIVDLDFDEILGKKENLINLFYLKKYSIENHLVSKAAIYEVIRTKNPKLKDEDIHLLLNFDNLLKTTANSLKELALSFVIIQKHYLAIPYHRLVCSRDFNFTTPTPTYRLNYIPQYLSDVEAQLKLRDKRYTFQGQIKNSKKYFKNLTIAMNNIPGKYILIFIKDRLQALNLISQMSVETFTYSLSKDFQSNELNYLRISISTYIT